MEIIKTRNVKKRIYENDNATMMYIYKIKQKLREEEEAKPKNYKDRKYNLKGMKKMKNIEKTKHMNEI